MPATARILVGDAREVLRTLPADSVQCCVTSPPYWGLRDYGVAGQIGLERTPEEYVEHLVEVFREVRRVLRSDGVLWLNLGDCYATGAGAVGDCPGGGEQGARWRGEVTRNRDEKRRPHGQPQANGRGEPQTLRTEPRSGHEGKHDYLGRIGPLTQPNRMPIHGLKPKDLVGIPWRVAFALQADGWWLRKDNIWHKPNPMPESTEDRTTTAHEYVFHLTKSELYFYDAFAVREPAIRRKSGNKERFVASGGEKSRLNTHMGSSIPWSDDGSGRNRRSVWTITTQPYDDAHFAVMPEKLVEPCILAGSSEHGACAACGSPYERIVEKTRTVDGEEVEDLPPAMSTDKAAPSRAQGVGHGRIETRTRTLGWRSTCKCETTERVPCVVLDPFGGSGTVAVMALHHRRSAVLVELNPEYARLAEKRITGDAPLFNVAEVDCGG
jgi:DNA modification methylase